MSTPSEESAARERHWVLFGLCLAAALAYVHRISLGVAESEIREEFQLSKSQVGWILSAFTLTYAIFQIPSGRVVDLWGSRRALLTFGLFSAITFGLGAFAGAIVLLLSRLSMGVAQAGFFPAATSSLKIWYPLQQRAFAVGMLTASMSLGAAIGSVICGWLLEPLGWRWLFVVLMLPGLAWSLWFFWCIAEHPPGFTAETTTQPPSPLFAVLVDRNMIWIAAQQFFRAMANFFYLSWFVTFLKEHYHLDTQQAGLWTSLPNLAVVLGSLAGGYVSDWVLRHTGSPRSARRGVAIVSLAIGVACFVAAYFIEPTFLAIGMIGLGSFFSSMSNPCAYSITMDMGGRNTAMVFGTMNMAGNIGATLFPILVPWWLLYVGDWGSVLFLVGGIYLTGAFCWLCIDPTARIAAAESDKS